MNIFLIESDPCVRRLIATTLARSAPQDQVHVVEFSTGEEVFEVIPRYECHMDCLITDHRMDGNATGLDVVREAKKRWPQAVYIAVSGGWTPEEKGEYQALGCRCLDKPFEPEALVEATRG